jgi:hypothetical protein
MDRTGQALNERCVSPNEFQGTDSERIAQAIDAAVHGCGTVLIPKMNCNGKSSGNLWLIDSAILLPGEITLILDNCHIKLSDTCRDNFIRSANCGLGIANIHPLRNISIVGVGNALLEGAEHPRATGDSAKTLGVHTYGCDSEIPSESQSGDWRNIGILMAFVDGFLIENIRIKDSHCWAMSLERCSQGKIANVDFASSGTKRIDGIDRTILNQDGLDLRQGCHDIIIENITGHTGDDLIAFTNILGQTARPAGSLHSTMVSEANNRGNGRDDIFNISLRNVKGFSRGGHHIVRLLNAGGLAIHDVIIDGLLDNSDPATTCRAALKIGDSNPAWGGVTPLGDTFRIFVSKVSSKASDTILIAGSLSESIIENVVKHDGHGDPIRYQSGQEFTRNLHLSKITQA